MSLERRVQIILDRANVQDGDIFSCMRTANAPIKRRYKYDDGLITTIAGEPIKPATVKNLLNYYIIEKE